MKIVEHYFDVKDTRQDMTHAEVCDILEEKDRHQKFFAFFVLGLFCASLLWVMVLAPYVDGCQHNDPCRIAVEGK